MGLDIGVPETRWLERPSGLAYDFAWYMNIEAAYEIEDGLGLFAHGEGNNIAWFERKTVRRLLRKFAEEKKLTAAQRAEVSRWVDSLPWEGGNLIELHFNW